jgi:hypothetical protein
MFQLVQCAQKITRYVCITDFFFLESAGELRIKYIKKGKKRSKMDQLQENLLTEARI